MKPVIIGIAGGTGSGKTTVARAIHDRVGKDRIEWISHDSYYRNFEGLNPEERHHINFDHPDSLETELLVRHVDVLRKGSAVEVPIYDFTTHSRTTATHRVEPRKVVIVEGILVLAEPELRKKIDIKLYADTPADLHAPLAHDRHASRGAAQGGHRGGHPGSGRAGAPQEDRHQALRRHAGRH